ncbi:Putative amidoligase enzyme [Marinobacter daqiaonensis]|uniref:Putative amidoligase enzyme n=1 Tax=Marinobacter daqiaonensis TaxID=650891 RepID=A0A1I6H762_9GAMM|nr:amidoligase family protein [Marinobacter daqiaonensis]SFR50325.1 Putative amidoligase enzyme [Marinobacter daqiaonensis]
MPTRCHMPDVMTNRDGETRRIGVEIEVSGLSFDKLVALAARLLEGEASSRSRYVSAIDTRLGEFTIELDSDPIKRMDLQDESVPESLRELGGHAMDVIDYAAERLVPLEIVSPPLPFDTLETIERLTDELREAGAVGSREAILYAFGLQLNPELPDLEADTLRHYLQTFAALYDWLKSRHQLDFSRKVTTYIEPWSGRYVDRLVAADYAPDMAGLMHDYLNENPTRNRALDLLPLFAHLDKDLLDRYVKDPRIKSRPTLHYRLPDCDIDNPHWHFSSVWNDWVVLEQVVANTEHRKELLDLFRASRTLSFRNLTSTWKTRCHRWLENRGYV